MIPRFKEGTLYVAALSRLVDAINGLNAADGTLLVTQIGDAKRFALNPAYYPTQGQGTAPAAGGDPGIHALMPALVNDEGWKWSVSAGKIINPNGSKTAVAATAATGIAATGTIQLKITYADGTATPASVAIAVANDATDLASDPCVLVIDLATITFPTEGDPVIFVHRAGDLCLAGRIIPSAITGWDHTAEVLLTANSGTMAWVTLTAEESTTAFECPA
jgi:hypothetical protein